MAAGTPESLQAQLIALRESMTLEQKVGQMSMKASAGATCPPRVTPVMTAAQHPHDVHGANNACKLQQAVHHTTSQLHCTAKQLKVLRVKMDFALPIKKLQVQSSWTTPPQPQASQQSILTSYKALWKMGWAASSTAPRLAAASASWWCPPPRSGATSRSRSRTLSSQRARYAVPVVALPTLPGMPAVRALCSRRYQCNRGFCGTPR